MWKWFAGLLGLIGLVKLNTVPKGTWEDTAQWLKENTSESEEKWNHLPEVVPHGAKIMGAYLEEDGEKLVRISHKLYYKEKDQWMEATTSRRCYEIGIPEVILSKIKKSNGEEVDITEEVKKELQIEI